MSKLLLDEWKNVVHYSKGDFWVKQRFNVIGNYILEYEDSDGNYWVPEFLMDLPFPMYKIFDLDSSLTSSNYESCEAILMGDYYQILPNSINLTSDIIFNNVTISDVSIIGNGYNVILEDDVILRNSQIYDSNINCTGNNCEITYCTIYGVDRGINFYNG